MSITLSKLPLRRMPSSRRVSIAVSPWAASPKEDPGRPDVATEGSSCSMKDGRVRQADRLLDNEEGAGAVLKYMMNSAAIAIRATTKSTTIKARKTLVTAAT